MANKIEKDFEAKHMAAIKQAQEKVGDLYRSTIKKIYGQANVLKIKGTAFRISDYPEFHKFINSVLVSFAKEVEISLVNEIKGQWELSIEKNAAVIHKAYRNINLTKQTNALIYDPQASALEQYISRSINGLSLSDRVWKNTNQLRSELEKNMYAGISEGKSAAEMARDQIKYLENPTDLFRRVRDAEGNLQLSEPAKSYHPGQGVYRSSYKNAMRLSRVIINDAYRQSDMARYKLLPFILSYNVNLSNNHPKYDICDLLTGTYPKTFIWTGWHLQCICNCTTNLASPEEFDKYQAAQLNGTSDKFKFKGIVTNMPDQFNEYIETNTGKMDNWKRKPDWVTRNGIKI